jgi:hypothetical protein
MHGGELGQIGQVVGVHTHDRQILEDLYVVFASWQDGR